MLKFRRGIDIFAIAMKISLISAALVLLSACSDAEKYEHIEAYMIETLDPNPNEEGVYVRTGYMKSNAITIIVEGKNFIKTDVKSIEDYYDLSGKFIKSEIKRSTESKSHVTLHEDGDSQKEERQEPSTILIPDQNFERHGSIPLTEEEKLQVKEHVNSFVDKM